MAVERGNAFSNLDTLHMLLTLLTDTIARFPRDISLPLDLARIDRNQRSLDTVLGSIVGSEPIINYALRKDCYSSTAVSRMACPTFGL